MNEGGGYGCRKEGRSSDQREGGGKNHMGKQKGFVMSKPMKTV